MRRNPETAEVLLVKGEDWPPGADAPIAKNGIRTHEACATRT